MGPWWHSRQFAQVTQEDVQDSSNFLQEYNCFFAKQ
jgi:hypothetical protein